MPNSREVCYWNIGLAMATLLLCTRSIVTQAFPKRLQPLPSMTTFDRTISKSFVTISNLAVTNENTNASPPPSPKTNKAPTTTTTTGGLRRLPIVQRSTELISKAKRNSWRILPDAEIKNARNRVRKQGAERLNAITNALCVPLRDVIQGYRRELRRLHPFEQVVADLTVRAKAQKNGWTLTHVLDDLNEARKEILIAGKDWIQKAKTAETARQTTEIMVRGSDSSESFTIMNISWIYIFVLTFSPF